VRVISCSVLPTAKRESVEAEGLSLCPCWNAVSISQNYELYVIIEITSCIWLDDVTHLTGRTTPNRAILLKVFNF